MNNPFNCSDCEQLKKLSAENKRLENEVNLLTLLMDVGLTVIEKWWKSLPGNHHDLDSPISDGSQDVRMLLEAIRKLGE